MSPSASPQLEFVIELNVAIGALTDFGAGPSGIRRTVPITGGTFRGPLLSGRVLPGGADWQIIESDGLTYVDAHYALETDDEVRIEVHNQGIRHGPADLMDRITRGDVLAPGEYYFRTTPRFYPPSGKYEWLRRSVFIASGERFSEYVVIRVWRVE